VIWFWQEYVLEIVLDGVSIRRVTKSVF